MFDMKDKVVIITGAASGLGRQTAEILASQGVKLTLVDLNEETLKEVEEIILTNNEGAEVLSIAGDVSDEELAKKYTKDTVEKFGKIDGFFNNAGIGGKQNLTEDFGSEEFDRVVSINLNGVFYGMQHVLKVMRDQGFGSVVNCASVGGIRGVGNQSGYAASKHGVVGLTKNSGIEYGQYGVRVNAIAPGAIMTEMVENSLKQMNPDNPEEAGKEFVSVNPMKRFGKPEEVAGLVTFLLADESAFVNAQTIPVDGGQSQKY